MGLVYPETGKIEKIETPTERKVLENYEYFDYNFI